MPTIKTNTTGVATLDNNGADSALYGVLERLLELVARLCLVFGITFAAVEEILKRSFVREALALQPELPEHGKVSRISTATGINRREVTRLTGTEAPLRQAKQPLAAELIARWATANVWRDADGTPLALRRLGPEPSFESLAHSITHDVHPRSILDELTRLGLVQYDAQSDTVTLVRTDFIPQADGVQMLDLLADNVGDHLAAAVANVTGTNGKHLEQAVFADELSAESAAALHPLITAHWQALREELVPVITGFIEADQRAGRRQDQRVRIGIYSFSETEPGQKSSRQGRPQRRLRTAAPKENKI